MGSFLRSVGTGLSLILVVLIGMLLVSGVSAQPIPGLATISPDFAISANPLNQTLQAGSSATSQVILTSIDGFTGTIDLTTSPPPLCISCPGWGVSPSSVNLTPGGTVQSTLTFSSTLGTPPRVWIVTVTGSSGTLSHSVNVAFTVVQPVRTPDFSLTANPDNLTIVAGSPGTSTVSVTSLNSFNGTVDLQTSPSPLCPSPYCTTWTINPSRVVLAPNSTAKAILTIYAGTGATGLSGSIAVSGTSGSLSHAVVVSFTIILSDPNGAVTLPVDKLAILAPYLVFALTIVGVGLASTYLRGVLRKKKPIRPSR